MRISKRQFELTPPKQQFTRHNNSIKDTFFDFLHHGSIHTTTVYLLHPPPQPPHSDSQRPWIVAAIEDSLTLQLRHPLTLNPHPPQLPTAAFNYSILAVSHHFSSFFDKLIVVPATLTSPIVQDHALFALYNGGVLRARPRNSLVWVTLIPPAAAGGCGGVGGGDGGDRFDDVLVYKGKVYALDREGTLYLINNYVKSGLIYMGKASIKGVVGAGSGFKWRKRVVVDGEKTMYMVMRSGEKVIRVYKRVLPSGMAFRWDQVTRFDGNKVLFMNQDYYFFCRASEFPGKAYKNCIVFNYGAFPSYGYSCWEWGYCSTQKLAVFRLGDKCFGFVGESKNFPAIIWSPPGWVSQQSSGLNVASFRAYAARCSSLGVKVDMDMDMAAQSQVSSDSDIAFEREPDEDEGLESNSQDEMDGEVQSDSKNSDSNDEKLEEMEVDCNGQDQDNEGKESDSGSQDQDHIEVESDSDSQDQEDGKMQCDLETQEKENEEMNDVNTDDGTALQEDMKINGRQQLHTPPSRKFTTQANKSTFKSRRSYVCTTTVYLLRPPGSLSSDYLPWIISTETTVDDDVIFCHPLTSKPYSMNLPRFSKLHSSKITVSYHFEEPFLIDKLLIVPALPSVLRDVDRCSLLALYGGGELQGCPRFSKVEYRERGSPWVKLSPDEQFDDITVFEDEIYGINRQGMIKLIHNYKTTRAFKIGRTLNFIPITAVSGRLGWRKRFVIDRETLYLVVRTTEKSFRVFSVLNRQGNKGKAVYAWDEVWGFANNKVLFMARDYYFFRRALRRFPGREYENCIVFSEAAFPEYGKDCWEFTESDDVRKCEDDIAVFRLNDATFAREGDDSCFPSIDWSPPAWIFNELLKHSVSESSSQFERVPDEDENLATDDGDENDGETQSDVNASDSKDEEDQEEMESESGSEGQDQDEVESDSDSQDKEDGKMQCDSNTQEKEDEEIHSNGNTVSDASLQVDVSPSLFGPKSGTTDTQTPLSAAENEITRSLSLNGSSNAKKEENLRKNITASVLRACASSTTKSNTNEYTRSKFEGFDIKSDLVATLQKIWEKHGNVAEKCIMRSNEIIARALESLATMVHILEDNTTLTLSDTQADYLALTLADLRCICFKVDWLVPYVKKAVKLHESKSLVESLNKLTQLSSQVTERKAKFLDELSKLNEEENKLKEEMEKVSKTIPFLGQIKFDEPIGAGFT